MVRLSVRPLAGEDFDGYIAYFTQASKADAERMGMAIERVPSATQLRLNDLDVFTCRPVSRARPANDSWPPISQTVDGSNFLSDVNRSGVIEARSRIGTDAFANQSSE